MIELGNVRDYKTGRRVFIQVQSGIISGSTSTPLTQDWIDCNNGVAMPGIIDPHIHERDDQPHKETRECVERGAILGGVTTVAHMPNQATPTTSAEVVANRSSKYAKSPISNYWWIGATNSNFGEITQTARHFKRECKMVKIYMGSSTGNLLVTDEGITREHFQNNGQNRMLTGVHAEDEALMQLNLQKLGRTPKVSDHCAIRSTEVEVSAVRTALRLQAEIGNPLYFCHISTPESLELIQDAKQAGRTVYAEVCPHHLYLVEALLATVFGGAYKMNPPLRSLQQIHRMVEYVCRPGWVDTIGSDHAPHAYPEEKLVPDEDENQYKKTASGVPGVQTILPTIFNLAAKEQMTVRHFVDLTSANAARIFGLKNKGRLEPGADADITVINDHEVKVLRDEDMATLYRWTPFHGMLACGFPSQVISQGQLVYNNKLLI
jgi:dihydroorotase